MPESFLDRFDVAQKSDRLKMRDLLRNFNKQVEEAIEIGRKFQLPRSFGGSFNKILFVGMGGSAIGGDVIRSLVASECGLPIWVSRHYDLPKFVDSKTLCIFSSYSGNTEETLAAFEQGRKKGIKALSITSGGELARLSQQASLPLIQIPTGFPPRAALGYSVFPLLQVFSKLKLASWNQTAADETLALLDSLGKKKYSLEIPSDKNPAKKLAEALFNRLVVIYAGVDLLDSAALRFRNQIEENAKALASHHLLAEMNHNEILGWQFPKSLVTKSAACIFLRDVEDHARIQLRIDFTKNLLAHERGVLVEEVNSQGKSRLARLFSVIYLGDWVSYYLALLYRIDPTPVVVIESLKKELAGVKLKK